MGIFTDPCERPAPGATGMDAEADEDARQLFIEKFSIWVYICFVFQ